MSDPLNQLIEEFSKLPGIGHKSAQRLAFHVLKTPAPEVKSLITALITAKNDLQPCKECGVFSGKEHCDTCTSPKRDRSMICVVQETKDVMTIERTKEYKGLYHVLNGVISPMEGMGPNDIRIKELLVRCQNEEVREIVIATNPNVEGEATAMYITNILKPIGIECTRLAYGLPVGGNLDFADDMTLSRALEHRRSL